MGWLSVFLVTCRCVWKPLVLPDVFPAEIHAVSRSLLLLSVLWCFCLLKACVLRRRAARDDLLCLVCLCCVA